VRTCHRNARMLRRLCAVRGPTSECSPASAQLRNRTLRCSLTRFRRALCSPCLFFRIACAHARVLMCSRSGEAEPLRTQRLCCACVSAGGRGRRKGEGTKLVRRYFARQRSCARFESKIAAPPTRNSVFCSMKPLFLPVYLQYSRIGAAVDQRCPRLQHPALARPVWATPSGAHAACRTTSGWDSSYTRYRAAGPCYI
jgi:hypothetical protein